MSANKVAPIQAQKLPPLASAAAKKSPIDPRYYFAVGIGVAAVVAVLLLSIFVIRPLINKSLSTAKDLQYRTQEVSQLTTKLNNLKQLKTNFLALNPDVESKVLVELPTDADQPHLSSLLATVAGQSGVQLSSISYSSNGASSSSTPSAKSATGVPTSSISAQSQPLSLSISGPYAEITAFVSNLEASPRLIDVTSVSISGASPSLTAIVTANAYFSPAAGSASTTSVGTGTTGVPK